MGISKRYVTELENKNAKLIERAERRDEEIQGYQELGKIHSAYIAILVKRLGATEDNPVEITRGEVYRAIDRYETRASFDRETDTYSLYCVEHEE